MATLRAKPYLKTNDQMEFRFRRSQDTEVFPSLASLFQGGSTEILDQARAMSNLKVPPLQLCL